MFFIYLYDWVNLYISRIVPHALYITSSALEEDRRLFLRCAGLRRGVALGAGGCVRRAASPPPSLIPPSLFWSSSRTEKHSSILSPSSVTRLWKVRNDRVFMDIPSNYCLNFSISIGHISKKCIPLFRFSPSSKYYSLVSKSIPWLQSNAVYPWNSRGSL